MKSKIVQLEDTPVVPVPQPLLDACHLEAEVELEVQGATLVIRSTKSAREGWEEAFQQMATSGDDKLVLGDSLTNKWDEEEWEW